MIPHVLAVRDEHLVLLRRDPGAGFDDHLAAGHVDLDRGNGLRRDLVAGLGGDAVEDDVGGQTRKEDPEIGLGSLAREIVGAEADPEDRERLLLGLNGALDDIAIGAGDLEDDGVARAQAAEGGIGDAAGGQIAQRGEAVFEDFDPRLGVAGRQDRCDILGGGIVGTVAVERIRDPGQLHPTRSRRDPASGGAGFELRQLLQ